MKKSKIFAVLAAMAMGLAVFGCKAETETEYVDKTYAEAVTFTAEDAGEAGVKVAMATKTEGAAIYYTTDGTEPTEKSEKYTEAVTFDKDIVVKAIAVKKGIENSPVSVAKVSIKTKTVEVEKTVEIEKVYAEAVTFTAEDAGDAGVKVAMSTATEGAAIYYTIDGTEPTENSEKYTEAVTFSKDTVVKAIAVKKGIENSPVSVAKVSIKTKTVEVEKTVEIEKIYAEAVTFTAEDAGEAGVKVAMSTATEGAVIYYTVDESSESLKYSVPLTFSKDTEIKAFAVKEGIENSPISVVKVSIKTKTITEKVYVCAKCQKEYNTAQEAIDCCAETSDTTAPADVTELAADAKDSSVVLTWKDATDEDIFGYLVSWKAESTGRALVALEKDSLIVAKGQQGCVVTGLTNGTKYTFTVKTMDTSGNTSGGVTVKATSGSGSSSGSSSSESDDTGGTSSGSVEPVKENFVKIPATSIAGTESWTPYSLVFVSGRKLEIASFYMSDHPVTRGEYKTLMGSDPSTASAYDKDGNKLTGGDDNVKNNPVNGISWYDALVYCNTRSIKEGLTPCYAINDSTDPSKWGSVPTKENDTWNAATCDFTANGYRLPTEAEWEWAARGGESYTCAGSDNIDEVAWYVDNTCTADGDITGTRDVKTKKKNAYGLYDMSGNVWEWCWDWYGGISSDTAASGPAPGSYRCRRGGSWCSTAVIARVADRGYNYPSYHRYSEDGFRLVRNAN